MSSKRFAVSAPEARKQVAHGETVGVNIQIEKAPDGAKEISVGDFLPPLPGLEFFWMTNPRFHRGLLLVAAPQQQMDFETRLT